MSSEKNPYGLEQVPLEMNLPLRVFKPPRRPQYPPSNATHQTEQPHPPQNGSTFSQINVYTFEHRNNTTPRPPPQPHEPELESEPEPESESEPQPPPPPSHPHPPRQPPKGPSPPTSPKPPNNTRPSPRQHVRNKAQIMPPSIPPPLPPRSAQPAPPSKPPKPTTKMTRPAPPISPSRRGTTSNASFSLTLHQPDPTHPSNVLPQSSPPPQATSAPPTHNSPWGMSNSPFPKHDTHPQDDGRNNAYGERPTPYASSNGHGFGALGAILGGASPPERTDTSLSTKSLTCEDENLFFNMLAGIDSRYRSDSEERSRSDRRPAPKSTTHKPPPPPQRPIEPMNNNIDMTEFLKRCDATSVSSFGRDLENGSDDPKKTMIELTQTDDREFSALSDPHLSQCPTKEVGEPWDFYSFPADDYNLHVPLRRERKSQIEGPHTPENSRKFHQKTPSLEDETCKEALLHAKLDTILHDIAALKSLIRKAEADNRILAQLVINNPRKIQRKTVVSLCHNNQLLQSQCTGIQMAQESLSQLLKTVPEDMEDREVILGQPSFKFDAAFADIDDDEQTYKSKWGERPGSVNFFQNGLDPDCKDYHFHVIKQNKFHKNTPRILRVDSVNRSVAICKNKDDSRDMKLDPSNFNPEVFVTRQMSPTLRKSNRYDMLLYMEYEIPDASPSTQKKPIIKLFKALFATSEERERFFRLCMVHVLPEEEVATSEQDGVYKPLPLKISKHDLRMRYLERNFPYDLMAAQVHQARSLQRFKQGWCYGKKYDFHLKTDPTLVPIQQLSLDGKKFVEDMVKHILESMYALGFVVKDAPERSHSEPPDINECVARELLALNDFLAENTHDFWAFHRLDRGWVPDEKDGQTVKWDPNLKPFCKLPDHEQNIGKNAVNVILNCLISLNQQIVIPPNEDQANSNFANISMTSTSGSAVFVNQRTGSFSKTPSQSALDIHSSGSFNSHGFDMSIPNSVSSSIPASFSYTTPQPGGYAKHPQYDESKFAYDNIQNTAPDDESYSPLPNPNPYPADNPERASTSVPRGFQTLGNVWLKSRQVKRHQTSPAVSQSAGAHMSTHIQNRLSPQLGGQRGVQAGAPLNMDSVVNELKIKNARSPGGYDK